VAQAAPSQTALVVEIGRDVAVLLPRQEWTAASRRLIWHGRRVCHARRLVRPGPFS
jgi:endonuclease III